MCILLNVKKHEKTFALNVDIFKKYKKIEKSLKLTSGYDKILSCDIFLILVPSFTFLCIRIEGTKRPEGGAT